MLPPGADNPPGPAKSVQDMLPPAAASSPSPAKSVADSLLPPGAVPLPPAAGGVAVPGAEVPLPVPQPPAGLNVESFATAPQRTADGSVLITTEDGAQIALREPVKTIGKGDDQQELRRLTPEERSRRRRVKNIVLWSAGALLLLITLLLLRWLGPL